MSIIGFGRFKEKCVTYSSDFVLEFLGKFVSSTIWRNV